MPNTFATPAASASSASTAIRLSITGVSFGRLGHLRQLIASMPGVIATRGAGFSNCVAEFDLEVRAGLAPTHFVLPGTQFMGVNENRVVLRVR